MVIFKGCGVDGCGAGRFGAAKEDTERIGTERNINMVNIMDSLRETVSNVDFTVWVRRFDSILGQSASTKACLT